MITQEELFGKCPFATSQKILSGKWALIVLHFLSEDTLRFNEIKRKLPEITQSTLTKQLRSLEDYGMVIRTVYSQIPPKVEYSLSPMGEDFITVLESLKEWGDKYIEQMGDL
jgi:DNA-binding HxlR family transcriptional regulator